MRAGAIGMLLCVRDVRVVCQGVEISTGQG